MTSHDPDHSPAEETAPPAADPAVAAPLFTAEPVAGLSEDQVEALSARLNALASAYELQAEQLASMTSAEAPPQETAAEEAEPGSEPMYIVAFDDPEYYAELELMTPWVDQILSAIFGAEVTAGRPWCLRWPEHPDAVARIHACWLAWQAAIDPQSGPAGPSSWLRDHLEPLLGKLRSPDGPFAACSSLGHISHRVLDHPGFTDPDALLPAAA
ncbi:hypothetical protein P3T36_003362 [Kitasatospora sp. MAP12-15]|uniref:DUF4913 domain-containing protein n=1 Tax=unclassified Kitasatospora TaxID=2633591 RepID=UPI0024748D05|nr:DUF4913 domain-containing protein [Kitasatospora sp. MAP12-44]MDH6111340.1 hypothetical protein [Kitasatospora sp. MAP12-44]